MTLLARFHIIMREDEISSAYFVILQYKIMSATTVHPVESP